MLGMRAARTLTPYDLTAFGESLLDSYSPVYVRNVCAMIRASLNWATKEKLIESNPVKGYRAPTITRSPARFAERAEAAAFISYGLSRAREHPGRRKKDKSQRAAVPYDRMLPLMIRCLIRTGARPKELCRLQWADIQWAGWKTATGHASAKAVIPPDRWKAGKVTGKPRTIYFTPALTRALRRMWDRGPKSKMCVFVHEAGRGGWAADEPYADGSILSRPIMRLRRRRIGHQLKVRERLVVKGRVKKA